MYGPGAEMLDLELAAQAANQRALQPQQHVQAEEPEDAEQQQRHEQVDVVHPRVLVPVHRVAVRNECQERSVDLAGMAVARAAGRRQVVGVSARPRVRRAQVMVRRVAVRAHGRRAVADRGGLAVEAVVEGLGHFLVAAAALVRHLLQVRAVVRRFDRVCFVAGGAHRAVLAVAPQCAVRAVAPFLQHALVAFAAHVRALLVRRTRRGIRMALDVVAAVAVAARRRRFGQAGLEQRARMDAAQVAVHHLVVARAAILHLVERRHRGRRVVAAHDRVDVAVAALAGDGLVALDPCVDAVLERRDLVHMAIHAHFKPDRPERLPLAFVLHRQCRGVALDASDPLMRRGGEGLFVHGDRLAGLVFHLGVVVTTKALRIRDRRFGGGGVGRGSCGDLLCSSGQRACQGHQQRQRGQGAGGDETANAEHSGTPSEGGAGRVLLFAHASCAAKSGTCEFHLKRPRRGCTHLPQLRRGRRCRCRPAHSARVVPGVGA